MCFLHHLNSFIHYLEISVIWYANFFQIFHFVDLYFWYLASLHSKSLRYTNHGVWRKGFLQTTFDIGKHYVCSGSERPNRALRKAIHTLLVGNRQAKVIASEWMRPNLRCDSLDTIPPNGIKVAQCTPLLHQRDLPSLVKLGAWRHSPFEDHLLFFHWQVKCPVFLTMTLIYRETGRRHSQRHASDLFLSGKTRVVW